MAALSYGLVHRSDPVRLAPEDATEVLALARFDHITGFLAAAAIGGAVTVDPETETTLMSRWHEELLGCVIVESLAVRTAEVLDDHGIVWRLTKGAAVAHLDYPDPAVRTFGDVDIVVHPEHWAKALAALSCNGYSRESDGLGAGYEKRYGKGATLTTTDGLEVDLHRRFAVGRFGVTSHMEDVFHDADSIILAGRNLPTLNPVYRLLHACYHASLGGFRAMRAFRDVAQLILVQEVGWEATFAAAHAWRAEAVVASAIVETWDRLSLETDHPSLRRARKTVISGRDRRALDVFHAERSFRAEALTALGALPIPEIPRYLWTISAPRLRHLHR